MTQHDPYFTPIEDDKPFVVPDTISDELTTSTKGYQFLLPVTERLSTFKWLLITLSGLVGTVVVWEAYTILIELIEFNSLLGVMFVLLLLAVSGLAITEAYRFCRGQKQLKHVDGLREQADMFIRERSHGKSTAFITELKKLYNKTPQGDLLQQVLSQQPDYLNDAEIITYLSDNFFTHLDGEAQQLITTESIKIGTLIALSPLAVVDSLVVLWRTMKMVNQINGIYGLRLTRIGQWQVFIKIVKATLLAAGTEVVISNVVDKTVTGAAGVIAGSAAQGLGIGIYSANLGTEAMKLGRPISFSKHEMPNINLISAGIEQGLNKLKEEVKNDQVT